jgi:type IV pilus assembly protein PilV
MRTLKPGPDSPAPRRTSASPASQRRCGGFSLIEVMVVVALFSFGLLGLVGLQAKAMQLSVSAEDSSRASLLANELASAMWGAGNVNLDAAVVTAWNTRVADASRAGLPNGAGTVDVNGNVAQITVSWRAPYEAAGTTHQYVTQVVIR